MARRFGRVPVTVRDTGDRAMVTGSLPAEAALALALPPSTMDMGDGTQEKPGRWDMACGPFSRARAPVHARRKDTDSQALHNINPS